MSGPLTRAESYTMILGGNEIAHVDAALVLEDEEVFRVREDDAGRLLIDCDLKDQQGQRIARIAKNTPVFVAEGYRAKIIPGEPSEVIRVADQQVVSRIERLGPHKISVTGTFNVDGLFVSATPHGIYISNAVIRSNTISGFGTGIWLQKNSLTIGFSPAR
jgi:hypothetical protein